MVLVNRKGEVVPLRGRPEHYLDALYTATALNSAVWYLGELVWATSPKF
jgi:hypothetical protein